MSDSAAATAPSRIAAPDARRERMYCDLRGYRVSVDVADPDAARSVKAIFREFETAAHPDGAQVAPYALGREGESWTVSHAGGVAYSTDILPDAFVGLEWQLVTDAIAHRCDLFHLHAAALRSPASSAAVVVAGVSGSGKTTLTLGLMTRGFLPYSDDVTLIDPEACAPTAFRRAFHIDDGTRSLLAGLRVPPAWDFDNVPAGYFRPPHWAEEAGPIRVVLFPTLAPGAAPALTPLTMVDAAARLLPFSATLTQATSLALRTAARIVAGARCYDLVTGDLDQTLDLVIEQVERDDDG